MKLWSFLNLGFICYAADQIVAAEGKEGRELHSYLRNTDWVQHDVVRQARDIQNKCKQQMLQHTFNTFSMTSKFESVS